MALHVTDLGAGDPVVLLHSGGMSSRQWRKLAEKLSATHRVLAPDLLGSGENPLWPEQTPFDFSLDVEAIQQITAALSAPFHIVGHSYGGLLALSLARKMPDLIRSISVYDPVAFGVLYDANDAEGLLDLARAAASPVFQDQTQGGGEAWFEAFVDYWNGPGSWRALPAPSRGSFLRVGRKVFYEVSSLMQDRTPRAAYAAVKAPALLLYGALSPAAAQRVCVQLAAAFPNASLRGIAGAGHMGPLTHLNQVNALIAQHIAANK